MRNLILLNRTSRPWPWPRQLFFAVWARARQFYGKRLGEKQLSLVFITVVEAKRLNKLYRRQNKPTNVLAFAGQTPDELGDILICLAVARRQAELLSLPVNEWLVYLFGHGLLHLLGFAHNNRRQAARLERAWQRLCPV